MTNETIARTSRRSVLGGVLSGAAALSLAGCGPGKNGPEPRTNGDDEKIPPPRYQRYESADPDVPGTEDGVIPIFYDYPENPPRLDAFPLPARQPISIMVQGNPPTPPAESNPNFQLVARQTGGDFTAVYAPYTMYREKFTVSTASGEVPDICSIVAVPQLPALLEKHFADLTEVLSGDGILKYPGLANIPTDSWLTPTINGRIYGVAKPLPAVGYVMTSRGDVLADRGISDPNVKLRDGADFVALLKELSNRGRNEFAMGADPVDWLMTIVKQMVGTPNVWRNDNGAFVHEFETEEMKVALSEAGKIIQADCLHPQSFSDPGQNLTWYQAGVTAIYAHAFVGWGDFARSSPEWNIGNIEAPRWEGGGLAPSRMTSPGFGSWMAFRKSDPDRLHELLSFADYIASPFGTQEYLEVFYGEEGTSYMMKDNNPIPVPDGPGITALQNMGGNHRAVLYGGGGDPELVDAQRDYMERALPGGVQDASLGLYSETSVTRAATFENTHRDLQRDILQGAKSLADWDEFVATWKAEVGDSMAEEYAAAAAS